MERKYVEEVKLDKSADVMAVFSNLKEDRFAPICHLIYKYPNQKLRCIPFFRDEDIESFLNYFSQKCHLSDNEIDIKLLKSFVVDNFETEYTVVDRNHSITFFAEKDELSGYAVIKSSGVETYTHGIHVNIEELEKAEKDSI